MLSAGVFAPEQVNFEEALLGVIDHYIQTNDGKFLKKTGVARAREFKKVLASLKQEALTPVQFMWRICSYIKMEKGTGPLGTSTELRKAMLNLLVSGNVLNVDHQLIKASQLESLQQQLLVLRTCAEVGVWYHIDNDKIEVSAKVLQAENKLKSLPVVNDDVAVDHKQKLLDAVQGYINDANAVWYKRWFKQEGIQRAEKLKELIAHLSDVEKLNDRQLCARVYELAHMPIGGDEGIFDTSKDLRLAVMKTLCECLGVDEAKIQRDINRKSMPIFTPTALGPSGHVPNVTLVSIDVRGQYIANALRAAPTVVAAPTLAMQ